MYTVGELYYDNSQGRWCINGYELHCGDSIEIYQKGKWKALWIDFNHSTKSFFTTPYTKLQRGIKARHKLI